MHNQQLPEFIRIGNLRVARKDLAMYGPDKDCPKSISYVAQRHDRVTDFKGTFPTQVDRDNALKELDNLLT